jgi:crotonobetainyl-CoA:carnitine CoA-transferase CaiB-like acyl-CoA transferase
MTTGRAALAGIRVVELCTGAAGPTVTKCLAEYGAEVLRIESRRRPDSHRGGANQARWNKSPSFVKLHRGKKSVTLNLQTERGRDLVLDLVRESDVVADNFSLGVLDRWGLGYDRLREAKPDIIFISLKGLGSTGPQAHHITWGPNLLCLFGMTYLWNHPNSGVPTQEARVQHPDFMAGVAGAAAVMAALLYRQRTGRGQYIDEAQIEVGANLFGPYYLDYIVNHRDPAPSGNRRPGAAPYGAYPCVGGPERWCAISVKSQDEWERFCAALDDPAWCRDQRFATPLARERNLEELDRHVGEWTRQFTGHEIMARLQAAGVAAAPIQDVEDQFERDPIARDRGLFIAVEEPEMGAVAAEFPPVRMLETPPVVEDPAPLFGEHTDEVLRDILRLSDQEIESLRAEGVLD